MSKRVAVIGAGPAGLVTVKELLAEGLEPTCLEKAPGLGGVFRFDEGSGVVWDSTRLTSSGALTAFSDFPVPPERTGHMLAREYADYLARYATSFGVDRRIRFGTTVEEVSRVGGNGWNVRYVDGSGTRSEERYDAVVVCSGLHQHPHRPRFPGQDTFTGTVLHSAQYRRPDDLEGKRVLVVGGGESGADIVAEVSTRASETVLSLRRGLAVVPRQTRGLPNDYRNCRLLHGAPHWVARTRRPADDGKRRVYRSLSLPLLLFARVAERVSEWGDALYPLSQARPWHPLEALRALKERHTTRAMIWRLVRHSGGTFDEQFGTKSDGFVTALTRGRCRLTGPIARFEGGVVVFEDDGRFEPDVVILCTGFETRVSFLDDARAREGRFLHLFAPSIGESLAFVGFVRPAHGAIPPLAELQARFLALVLSGKRPLPREEAMRKAVEEVAAERRDLFPAVTGRLEHLVDFTSFCDELASRIGCKPTEVELRRESRAFRRRYLAAPFVAAQYRLVGPHAAPNIARRVIEGLPIALPLPRRAALHARQAPLRALDLLGSGGAPGAVVPPRLSRDARACLPDPRTRRRIRLLFTLVLLSVPVAELMRRSTLEPYPALLLPAFSEVPRDGMRWIPTLTVGFGDGSTKDLDPAVLWPALHRGQRETLLRALQRGLGPRPDAAAPPSHGPWRSLLPGLQIRQRRRQPRTDVDPALRLWLSSRLAEIHPGRVVSWIELSGFVPQIEYGRSGSPADRAGRVRLDL